MNAATAAKAASFSSPVFARLEAVRFHGASIVDSQCNGDLKM
jgi:hypothetical protein